jgi:hypothetical protein
MEVHPPDRGPICRVCLEKLHSTRSKLSSVGDVKTPTHTAQAFQQVSSHSRCAHMVGANWRAVDTSQEQYHQTRWV